MNDSGTQMRASSSRGRKDAPKSDRRGGRGGRGGRGALRGSSRGPRGRSVESTKDRFSGAFRPRGGRGGSRGRSAHAAGFTRGASRSPPSALSTSDRGFNGRSPRGGRGTRGGKQFERGRGRGGFRGRGGAAGRERSRDDASKPRADREEKAGSVRTAEGETESDAEAEYEKGSILALLSGQDGEPRHQREKTPHLHEGGRRKKGWHESAEAGSRPVGSGEADEGKQLKKKRKRDGDASTSVARGAGKGEEKGEEKERSKKKEKKGKGLSSVSGIFAATGDSKAGAEADSGLSRLTALFSGSALASSNEKHSRNETDAAVSSAPASLAEASSSSFHSEVANPADSKADRKKRGDALQSAVKKARAVAARHRREAMEKRSSSEEGEEAGEEPSKKRRAKKGEESRDEGESSVSKLQEEEGEREESSAEDDEDSGAGEAEAGWRETDKEKERRTVFVGNLPLSGWKPPALYKHLGIGRKDVESIRLRSIPVHPKFNKCRLGGIVQGQFTDLKDFQNAYIVLKDRKLVRAVLQHDGSTFQDRRLRVDEAGERGQNVFSRFDRKKTVFVGNLPARCSEEDLRKALECNGAVKAVRIIRDKVTTESKGFGFVCFEDRVSAARAVLASNGVASLQGRALRVTRALDEVTSKMEDAKRRHEKEKKRARRGGVGRGVSPAVRRMMQKKVGRDDFAF
ncbi:hypothetical protein NCLIV_028890 [Neospora caninum Liverpool]|uniref:RRM domain-containing protein n=1 Tax=Neospora caninum (strain Liverpool) TaxID=572307 RepID=F0VHA7_NEOCL|nr:hypothetical protein NCLIV_028890 [Neospora caninum Liverpool]CBZ53101.1 hypothetical protein NCLIV_028890 [Neospora caninum Liverpool]|eukprot:XP_003883133.1 hypothetical protein NCLIV_028890 [Neospora caninum Liverpool]